MTGLRMAQLVDLYMVPEKEENEGVLSFKQSSLKVDVADVNVWHSVSVSSFL